MEYNAEDYWSLKGKRAVVTGASRGIGRSIAEALACAGAEVLVHYNTNEEQARLVVDGIHAKHGEASSCQATWSCQADLTDPEQVKRLFNKVEEKWGALDILVNNAGSLIRRCRIEELTNELIESVIRLNFHAALFSSRAAIPLLRKGISPSIINVSSIGARNGGATGSVLYSAMKGALVSFTRGLAKEIAPDIRVNAIAPAAVPTDSVRENYSEEDLKRLAEATPMKRLGRGEDTAAAVVFLCSTGASYITGEVLDVSGGRRFVF